MGHIENANQQVEGQIRTWISYLQEKHGTIDKDHPMLPWLIRHAAWCINHYQVRADGKTSYSRIKGKEYKGELAELGERILWHAQDKQLGKITLCGGTVGFGWGEARGAMDI